MDKVLKGEIIFLRLLLPLTAGITAGFYLPANQYVYCCLLAASVLCLLLAWLSVYFYSRYRFYLKRWKPGILFNLIVFFLAAALCVYQNPGLSENHFSKYSSEGLVLIINSEPKRNGDILRFEAKVKQRLSKEEFYSSDGTLLVALKVPAAKGYNYGDELLVPAVYAETEPPYNPYEFDYKNYLANRGILHQSFLDDSQVVLLGRNKANYLIEIALSLRTEMVAKYRQYIHDAEAASVASTLILGYKAELSKEVLTTYSKTGTMHVLSVSGMHVGIVFFILNAALWFMNRTKALRIARAAIIISLIWFYALITGFSPSVCRAALMLSMYVLGKAVSRRSNSYNLVAISAVLLLIYNPYFLLDVGFQLSYLAVLGLIYFYPKIYHAFYIRNWLGDKIWSYIALSCAAQLATFPLAMYYFHQFPVYFLLSNLFIVLPVILIMYLGIAFLFIPWEVLLKPLGNVLGKSILLMDKGLAIIERLPLANVSAYHSLGMYILLYLIIAGLFLSAQYKSKKLVFATAIAVLLLVAFQSGSSITRQQRKQITFYSLRKGNAFSFARGDKVWLCSNLDSSDKALTFSVHTAVNAQADDVRFIQAGQKLREDLVYFHSNFIKFGDWTMLRWDKEMIAYNYPVAVDVLLLSGRPKIKISELKKYVRFKLLLIDATNPDYLIKNWEEEAKSASVNYYVLKRNPAYVISLN